MKNNKILILVLTIIALTIVGILLLFKNNTQNTTYKITFDNGQLYFAEVLPNEKIKKPSDPIKDNLEFIGWYYNNILFDFDNPCNENIYLKAYYLSSDGNIIDGNGNVNNNISISNKIIPKQDELLYTVKFFYDKNEIEPLAIYQIKSGDKIENIILEDEKGKKFEGWLIGEEKFNFDEEINSNISLYGKWSNLKYTVSFNSNGGSSISNQQVNYDNVPKNVIPSKNGYTFNGWLYDGKIYNFDYSFNKDITLTATWIKNEIPTTKNNNYSTITFNSNGGENIDSIKALKGNSLTSLPTASKNNYIFDGWYTNSKEKFNLNTKINNDITLYANWIPTIKYTYNNTGKFFFINNPELLMDRFTADSSNKAAIYREEFNGDAEFYFEHIIHYGYSYYYAIKVFNPNKNSVTLSFDNCAADSQNKTDSPVSNLLNQYYGNCLINQKAITLGYNETAYIYVNPNSSNYKYYTSKDTANVPSYVNKVSGNIEGFIKMHSSGNLIFAVIIFNDITKSNNTIYNGNYTDITTDNYGSKRANATVYSGKLNTLNVTNLDFTYDIYDTTPKGTLLVNYKDASNKNQTLDYWITNYRGNINSSLSAIGSDYAKLIIPIDSKNSITIGPYPACKEERNVFSKNNSPIKGNPYNWANWGIHYDEKIKISNHTNSQKSITYRISYSNCEPTNRLGIYYNNQIYTLGHNSKYKDIIVNVPAGKSVTINPISTLTGFSCEYSKKQLILNN